MNALVLLNPMAAGGKAEALYAPMQAYLAQHFPAATLLCPKEVASALAALRKRPQGSRVVVVGGDGTLHQLLPALLERQLQTGLLPYGSGNDMARALGLHGRGWQQALSHALLAPARPIDVGWVHWSPCEVPDAQPARVPFISSLSLGFDASVGLRASQGPKWLRGMPRYLLATMQELRHFQLWSMTLVCDQQPLYQGPALLAASLNTPTYGGGMPAAPQAQLNDGCLRLLLGTDLTLAATLRLLPRLLLGRHLGFPKVVSQSYRHLEVRSAQALPLAADGEYLGSTGSLQVSVQAGGLPMVGR